MSSTIFPMAAGYDLWYDATTIGGDLVVMCWISHSPRNGDATFDPRPGDLVVLGDDEEAPLRGQVLARDGDRVTVQVELPEGSAATTSGPGRGARQP